MKTKNQEPKTRNQEPGTKNQEPRTRNQEPRTRNQEPRTRNHPTEHELLLSVIHTDHVSDDRIRELIRRGLDWQVLGTTALRHGVLPLLYTRLDKMARDLAPQEEMARLRKMYLATARYNLLLTQRLLGVVDILAGHGIEVIPFKGPVLAVQAYGDICLRRFVDVDIIIHPEDFRRVHDLLIAHGYSPLFPVNKKREKWLLRSGTGFLFSTGSTHLDVHWSITQKGQAFQIKPERLWQNLRPVCLNGRELLGLSPENTLLLAWLHGVKHQWEELKWVADLIRLLHACSDEDRLSLLGQAEKLPARMRTNLVTALSEPLALAQYAFSHRPGGVIRNDALSLLAQAFTPKAADWMVIDLPDALYLLYYLVRPLRLVCKYGVNLLNLMPRRRT